jgi:demethylmenaquinone methyltransferase/2-methoxy-6-polyprenyl-1,4-benzoquinol methylase
VTNVPPEQVEGAIRSREDVRVMFDRIVPAYDRMNRIMTGGRDVAWRRLAVREALRGCAGDDCAVLDVATGTGDLALALRDAGVRYVTGLDFSVAMLAAAARKEQRAGPGQVVWVEADAMALPFADGTFDAVTVAFGLRNMPSYPDALREMTRVLRPGGRLVCLETTPFALPVLRPLVGWYMTRVVPMLGRHLGGDRDAYSYLPASAAVFPDAETLGQIMMQAGLTRVRYRRLGLGTVALHVGQKS